MTKGEKSDGEALRKAKNEGLQREDNELHDPEHLSPKQSSGKTLPPQKRSKGGPPEDQGEKPESLENPPQVDGPREKSNDAV